MKIGNDEYYHPVLNIPAQTQGDWKIEHHIQKAGVPFKLNTFRTALYGQRGGEVSWDYDTTWHLLKESDGIWMTDFPIEQKQHDDLMKGLRGSLLIGGLGLGYAAVLASTKKSVKEIVVVEKSPEVCALVWPHLQKHGAVRYKAQLVNEDLFEYLKHVGTRRFANGFYDIWQGDGESTFHETVVPLRRLSKGKVRRVICWNEDVMRGQLAMGLNSRILMITNPKMKEMAPEGMPVGKELLDKLCEYSGNVYVDWAVPFWRKVKHLPVKQWMDLANTYARFAYDGTEEEPK